MPSLLCGAAALFIFSLSPQLPSASVLPTSEAEAETDFQLHPQERTYHLSVDRPQRLLQHLWASVSSPEARRLWEPFAKRTGVGAPQPQLVAAAVERQLQLLRQRGSSQIIEADIHVTGQGPRQAAVGITAGGRFTPLPTLPNFDRIAQAIQERRLEGVRLSRPIATAVDSTHLIQAHLAELQLELEGGETRVEQGAKAQLGFNKSAIIYAAILTILAGLGCLLAAATDWTQPKSSYTQRPIAIVGATMVIIGVIIIVLRYTVFSDEWTDWKMGAMVDWAPNEP